MAKTKAATPKKTVRRKKEVLPKQSAGDKLVQVRQFQVVVNPGTSVAIFWDVATKNEENKISSVTANFAESLNGVVQHVYAGTTSQGFGTVSKGSVSTNPHAFDEDPDKRFEAILSGTILTPEGYEMFFFCKSVVLEQPEELAAAA